MLAYFSYGKRRYYESPLYHLQRQRRFWEFQAVIKGGIGKVSHNNTKPEIKAATLWLSSPGSDHGWTGERNKEATIVVFHFRYIPESLSTLISGSQDIQINLSNENCNRLRTLGCRVQNYWDHPAPGMLLCYEHALLELSVFVYEALSQQQPLSKQTQSSKQVQEALVWYNEHMQENPGLPEIARAAHSSPANLRRLFHRTLQASPKEVLDQLRYQRAMQLLTETTQSLAIIAEQCGFQDQSAFSRAFKNHFQCSPREIRSTSPADMHKTITYHKR
jgi:AraC family transcriptional regulator